MSFSQEMGDEELLHVLEVQECVYKQRKILATNGGSSGASTGVIQQQQTTTTTNVIPAVDSKRSGSATVVSSSASSTIRSPVTTTSTTAVAATTTATTAAGVGTAGRENMPKYNQQGGAMFSPPAKQLVPVTPSTASPSMSFMSPMVGDKRSAEMMAMTPLSSAAYTPTSHQQGGGGGGGGSEGDAMQRAMTTTSFVSSGGFKNYQGALRQTMSTRDTYNMGGKNALKRSGVLKLASVANVSTEIKERKVERDQNGHVIFAEFVIRAFHGDRFCEAYGSCHRCEKKWSTPNHDIPTTAETRAKKRAVCEITGTSGNDN